MPPRKSFEGKEGDIKGPVKDNKFILENQLKINEGSLISWPQNEEIEIWAEKKKAIYMEIPDGLMWCCTVEVKKNKKNWAAKLFLNVAFAHTRCLLTAICFLFFSLQYLFLLLLSFSERSSSTDCRAQCCSGPSIVFPVWGFILIRAIVNESHSVSAAVQCEVEASQSQSCWRDTRKKENKDSRTIMGGIGTLHLGRRPPLSGCRDESH